MPKYSDSTIRKQAKENPNKWFRVFDREEYADRYTIVFMQIQRPRNHRDYYEGFASSAAPFHPMEKAAEHGGI